MQQTFDQQKSEFVDRRQQDSETRRPSTERRQFQDSRTYANQDVQELAEAVDQYKMRHRRRFITFEELFEVVKSLGYHK
ncbi:MAG: hypothetical protein KDA65_09010 [Planctomycetaceae bacterium]|nr:hypothetical protein [Planctomycetaceae bacterium]